MRLIDLDELNMGWTTPNDLDADSYEQGALLILDRLYELPVIDATLKRKYVKKPPCAFCGKKGLIVKDKWWDDYHKRGPIVDTPRPSGYYYHCRHCGKDGPSVKWKYQLNEVYTLFSDVMKEVNDD